MNTITNSVFTTPRCNNNRLNRPGNVFIPALLSLAFLCPNTAAAAVSGKLSSLTVANLSPAFDPNITAYTIPQPADCGVAVTAAVPTPDSTDPNLKLYIASNPASSGASVNAWLCNGKTKVDIVIFDVWKEVGRYTITSTGSITPPPPPEPNPNPEPDPIPPALLTIPTPVGQSEAIRFLEQASFGPTPADIAAIQAVGPDYWMAEQANLPIGAIADNLDMNQLYSRVFLDMHSGPDQLRQRMVFALGQILVVSANKNIYGDELIPWVRLLNKHAFGNYRSLLREVSLSPAMGKYLDLANSMKGTANTSPNENYARELMQLFTIGLNQLNQDGSEQRDAQNRPIPSYDQTTLREVARALTGWTYPTKPGATAQAKNPQYFVGLMEPRPQNHDTEAKTLLNGAQIPANQTVGQDLDAVVDNLFEHANLPPFIATRLIRSLVTSNPSPDYIERVANVFADNGHGMRGDLWAVLKAVLTDAEAGATPTFQHGHLKDPLLHVISMGRALNAQVSNPGAFMYVLRNLGQQVLSPNTVFSFYSPLAPLPVHSNLYGPEFQIYSPGMSIQRANFIYQILSGQLGSSFSIDLTPFNAVADDADALVEQVNQRLMQGRMSGELRQVIVTATQATQGVYNRVLGALYLAAISSEYAVQR